MGKQFDNVNCQYGAPMGRPSINFVADSEYEGMVQLFRVNLDSGGYDDGGAYWGIGPPSVYCARAQDFQYFVRAASRDLAKALVQEEFPSVKFYR